MRPELFPLLVGGSMLTVFAAVTWLSARQSKRAWFQVEALATRLGLTIEPAQIILGIFYKSPLAAGTLRGKRVEIYTFTTGSGKSRVHWCALSVLPAATGGLTFTLSRQGLGTKLSQLFGVKEITVGDPAFDTAWFIQTNAADFFRAALLPELRHKLDQVFAQGARGTLKLENGKVLYTETGAFDEPRCRRFESVVEIACDFADVAEVHAAQARR